jgi:hypothetical protein
MSKYPSVYGPEGTYEYQFRDYLEVERAYCESIVKLANYTIRAIWVFEVGETIKFPIHFIINEHSIVFETRGDQRDLQKMYPSTFNDIRLFILHKMKSGFTDDYDS